jgi:hypothetical protein
VFWNGVKTGKRRKIISGLVVWTVKSDENVERSPFRFESFLAKMQVPVFDHAPN